MRLWGITTEIVGFIPKSLVLRSIVLGCIPYSNAPTRARGIIKLSYRENYVMVNNNNTTTLFYVALRLAKS